ncbi:MAG: 3-isopropylmalate dehydrogenase [Coriobacteriales bacterium]|jgi:3-isopropylmalate dehydrogenase
MREFDICTLPGDGIGPEIMAQALRVLEHVGSKNDCSFNIHEELIGGCAIDATGSPYPEKTEATAKKCDAVLLAAVGGKKWDKGEVRPEQGLLALRKSMGAYCNLRPIQIFDSLIDSSTLKPEVVRGVDLLIVRELTGGIYFGRRATETDVEGAGVNGTRGARAYDTMEYSEYEIERIARYAFEMARKRRSHVTSVDKANVLDSSKLWRKVVHELGESEYPDVELDDMLVDNTAMQLVKNPGFFDVIVTENTFGDILSDEASMITGSLGMLASASLGSGTPIFEPCHGSAPDIAGKGIANPLAQILSVAMMLRYALDVPEAADSIEKAVNGVLDSGWRTPDLATDDDDKSKVIGTVEMGDKVLEAID